MKTNVCFYGLVLAAIVSTELRLCAQTPVLPRTDSIKHDTIVVLRRDTVVVVQRDTLFIQESNDRSSNEEQSTGLNGVDFDPSAYPNSRERIRARREALKASRHSENGVYVAPEDVRGARHAWAYYFYPSRFLDPDFQSIAVGATYARNGKFALNSTLGFLVKPSLLNGPTAFREYGEARYGMRGVDVGLEGRIYLSQLYDREPVYFGFGVSGAIAAVKFDRYISVPNGTYRRFQSVNGSGQRFELTGLIGWELRSKAAFAMDISIGADLGWKGFFSPNQELLSDWNRNSFLTPGEFNAYLIPVFRIGLGFGKW